MNQKSAPLFAILIGAFASTALSAQEVSHSDWFPGSSSVTEEEVMPSGFRGKWAPNSANCSDPDGVENMFIYAQGIDFYESGGRLDRVTQAGQTRSIRMKLAFEGEGGFWDVIWTATLAEDGRSVRISEDGREGSATYVKCPPLAIKEY